MNFFKHLRITYGKSCLDDIKQLEQSGLKVARYKNHLRFNLHCKHHSVTPVSLRLKSSVKGSAADTILRKAEKSLLNVRIGQTISKLKHFEQEKSRLSDLVYDDNSALPSEVKDKIKEHHEFVQLKEHEKVKERQQAKYAKIAEQSKKPVKPSISSECISKWVRNCSQRILSDPELSVLAKGLNCAVTPRKIPVVDIITETESVCGRLPEGEKHVLRAKVASILKNPGRIESNVSKEELNALDDLRKDDSIEILPADKGRCVVVLDKTEYHQKCEALLNDTKTYKRLGKRNPTSGYKKQLVALLTKIEADHQINRDEYYKLYPTTETPPKFYGLPKIHKEGRPLRPIVSSCGSISYPCSRFLSDVLKPLVGQSPHHIKNTAEFADKIKECRVEEDEVQVSHDVVALFTSVPVDRAAVIIHKRLLEDTTLTERTNVSVNNIIELLTWVLSTTYFVYQGVYYKQIHGAAMGSPVSPIVCNLFMEDLEQRAIATALNPPGWWYRYVDDSHSKHKRHNVQEFTDHLNSQDEDVKFTVEYPDSDNRLAFLDSHPQVLEDGSIKLKVYRKPTHTDQYLSFSSNHPIEHKLGVIRTLYNRAETIVTTAEDRAAELDYVDTALTQCGYPKWALKKFRDRVPATPSADQPAAPEKPRFCGKVQIPYIPGLSDKLKRAFLEHNVQFSHKPINKLRGLLVAPKDKSLKGDITGTVYRIPCSGGNTECKEFYIGETDRDFWTRFSEHKRKCMSKKSEVAEHIHIKAPDHQVDFEQTQILDRDSRWYQRGIREAIYIRAQKPTLNRNAGRYSLPVVWNPIISLHAGNQPAV